MFYIDPSEAQPNLNFYPYIGIYLAALFGLALMIVRIRLIYKRNQTLLKNRYLKWLIPFLEPVLIILSTLPFFLLRSNRVEVIEQFAALYYIEVLTWEVYIYVGLVPTNSSYEAIFSQATTGMAIEGKDGTRLVSRAASRNSTGNELHTYSFDGGTLLWNKDVSALQKTIKELNRSAETLAQKGALLSEEIKTRNEEARLNAKNQIYDHLTREVQNQLRLMEEIIQKWCPVEDNRPHLCHLCVLGTYVKQRCNLRLIQKESGMIRPEDLHLSLDSMIKAMNLVGIDAEVIWMENPEQPIDVIDTLEARLEETAFASGSLTIIIEKDRTEIVSESRPDHV